MVTIIMSMVTGGHPSYSGHKSSVTCLVFSEDGTRVVSGSKDTHVIIWDLISEAGLYR